MRAPLILALGPLLLTAALTPLSAQAAEELAVQQTLAQVFSGMAEADSAKIRAVFAEGARFALLMEEDPDAPIRYSPVDGWLAQVARSENRWEERIHDVEIRVDGAIASAWTPYTFHLDGALRHCGVNSIELLRTPSGWRITQLSDTRRTEGCGEGVPIPRR